MKGLMKAKNPTEYIASIVEGVDTAPHQVLQRSVSLVGHDAALGEGGGERGKVGKEVEAALRRMNLDFSRLQPLCLSR